MELRRLFFISGGRGDLRVLGQIVKFSGVNKKRLLICDRAPSTGFGAPGTLGFERLGK